MSSQSDTPRDQKIACSSAPGYEGIRHAGSRASNSDLNSDQKIGQRTIVADMALKGLSPGVIRKDRMDTLPPDAVADSSVTRCFCEACSRMSNEL
jgi:hypothetical protein